MPSNKSQPVISRQIAYNIIALVDYCYRHGVEDAHFISDEGLAREFLDKINQVGVYGFLNEENETMSWKEWTLRLMAQSRMTNWNGAMTRYFDLIGSKVNQNYLGAFIPVSQAFYARGVKDYITNPYSCDFGLFSNKKRVYWTEKGLMKINNRRYVDDIQLCAFDLQRRDNKIYEHNEQSAAKKMGALTQKQYDWFIRAVGLALLGNDDK